MCESLIIVDDAGVEPIRTFCLVIWIVAIWVYALIEEGIISRFAFWVIIISGTMYLCFTSQWQ